MEIQVGPHRTSSEMLIYREATWLKMVRPVLILLSPAVGYAQAIPIARRGLGLQISELNLMGNAG